MTEDEKINNGLRIGMQTIADFCGMESESLDADAALLALFQTAATALRYRGWSDALLQEHFALGLDEADKILQQEEQDLPEAVQKEPTLH